MKKIKVFTICLFFIPSLTFSAGIIDDFEGHAWSYADYPSYNSFLGDETGKWIHPAWQQTQNGSHGGADYGYISRELTKGANGTGKSLKFTVMGGSTTNNNANQQVYGYGMAQNIYFLNKPAIGGTLTIDGFTWTLQNEPRTGAGQVQIGSTTQETVSNFTNAINEDKGPGTKVCAAWAPYKTGASMMFSWQGSSSGGMYQTVPFANGLSNTSLTYMIYPSRMKQEIYNKCYGDLVSNTPKTGAGYIFFCSAGAKNVNCNYDTVLDPAIRPNTNAMSLYMLSPNYGAELGSAVSTYNFHIGTYTRNPQTSGGHHFYHHINLPKSNFWTKIYLNQNADHNNTIGGYCNVPENATQTWWPSEGGWNYFEGFTSFYLDLTSRELGSIPPWSWWVDEVSLLNDPHYNQPYVNNEYVASRSIAYMDNDIFRMSWTGRWGDNMDYVRTCNTGVGYSTEDKYEVFYTLEANPNYADFRNWTKAENRLSPGAFTFSRPKGNRFGMAEFVVPGYQLNQKITVAISPLDVPSTAGFIDYSAGGLSEVVPPQPVKYNLSHFISVFSNWLKAISSSVDINNDGKIDAKDLGKIMSNWE